MIARFYITEHSTLWEPRHKNKVFLLKETPSQICSGDTRGCQKAKIVDVYDIKNDDFHLKQPDILYNSLYITTLKKLHATS